MHIVFISVLEIRKKTEDYNNINGYRVSNLAIQWSDFRLQHSFAHPPSPMLVSELQ